MFSVGAVTESQWQGQVYTGATSIYSSATNPSPVQTPTPLGAMFLSYVLSFSLYWTAPSSP